MSQPRVLIAGGGISGMAMALTLHEIGVPCVLFEAVKDLRPLGVGINLQPNAVRELFDLGIGADLLDGVGLMAREWALVGRNGNDIYAEPRGLLAGYRWPQYGVHRGKLQMLLYQAVLHRLGADTVQLGSRVTGYHNNDDGTVTAVVERADGTTTPATGAILVGADGLHSAVRAQMYPDQPPPRWGGSIMWRGTSPGHPVRSGASLVGLGTYQQRLVFYPISPLDPMTGLATINWIAEVAFDSSAGLQRGDWNQRAELDDFLHYFEDWQYDWLDVPALLKGAEAIYKYPMIDRDPVPSWRDGNVVLIGDAAHLMYPNGSNGGSQAIVDARVLGACLIEHGVTPAALEDFDRRLCADISKLVLVNRAGGPARILDIVDERCGGVFDNIDDVVSPDERNELMSRYKAAAGLAIEKLNSAPPTIPADATVAA